MMKKILSLLLIIVIFSVVISAKHKGEEKLYNSIQNPVFPFVMTLTKTELSEIEKEFIAKYNPFGFLFHCHNIRTKDGAKKLIAEIKQLLLESQNRKDNIFFMVDQEGGRVNRLKCMDKETKYPPQFYFGNLAKKDPAKARKEILKHYTHAAKIMEEIGINMNLAPVLDVMKNDVYVGDSDVVISSINFKEDIGDRAFSSNPKIVRALGDQVISIMKEHNIYSTVKHIPGLGSSTVNSHYKLPIIDKSLEELRKKDFMPFKNLQDVHFAMVPHAKYMAIDKRNVSTFSKKVIRTIRTDIGFQGFLISDALNMKALGKMSIEDKIEKTFASGIDIAMPFFSVNLTSNYEKVISAIPRKKIVEFNQKLERLSLNPTKN